MACFAEAKRLLAILLFAAAWTKAMAQVSDPGPSIPGSSPARSDSATTAVRQPATGVPDQATNLLRPTAYVGTKSISSEQPKLGRIDRMEVLNDAYKLSAGDRLSFRIIEDQGAPQELIITDSGDVEVPYIGRYSAARKTCKELAYALKKELEKEYYYHATVIIAVDISVSGRH